MKARPINGNARKPSPYRTKKKIKGERKQNVSSRHKKLDDEIQELTSRIANECPCTPDDDWKPHLCLKGGSESKPSNNDTVEVKNESLGQAAFNKPPTNIENNSADSAERRLKNTDSSETVVLTDIRFDQLPISRNTRSALNKNGFTYMTPVQLRTVPAALTDLDVLCEAKTGSGKTLAFLIPVIEKLFRSRWSKFDGVGSIILSPTRELSNQIFHVCTKLLDTHMLTATCLIGGSSHDLDDEEKLLNQMNIIIATPGRLKHYLTSSCYLDTNNVNLLVIDEADRMLDLGFFDTVCEIVNELPSTNVRQTLLVSATLSSAHKEICKISMKSPSHIYTVKLNKTTSSSIPAQLKQVYWLVPMENKIDVLYQFLRTHTINHKVIVFMSSCKQVRFFGQIFKKIKTGSSTFALHGRLSQTTRERVISDFTKKSNGTLICTDIAARGVDIPEVKWVVQFDCPDSTTSYIHRVGRTARLSETGNAILFLAQSELKFIQRLTTAQVQIKQGYPRFKKTRTPVQGQISSLLSADSELKELAKKSLQSYIRSYFLMPDKRVCDVKNIPMKELSESYGLMFTVPVITTNRVVEKGDKTIINKDKLPTFHDNPQKRRKNYSKLEKLKEKIFEKKRKLDGHALETKTGISSSVRLDVRSGDSMFQLQNKADDDDDFLMAKTKKSSTSVEEESDLHILSHSAARTALGKERIKLKSDGTAIVKGVGSTPKSDSSHILFG